MNPPKRAKWQCKQKVKKRWARQPNKHYCANYAKENGYCHLHQPKEETPK